MNHFTLKPEEYKRDLDIVGAYVRDTALYLSRMEGKPFDECERFVRKSISERGKFPLQDPPTRFLSKNKVGDRELTQDTFLNYLEDVTSKQSLLAPTLTVYVNPKFKKSLLANYIKYNMGLRKADKKDMFKADMAGDKVLYAFKKVMQNTRKIKNNSLSGAHGSASTILFLKSAHPTLTSVCRCGSGYGNANNEKFLMGNRHYWHPLIVQGNILSIINQMDKQKFRRAMDKYNVHYPSGDEVMECIEASSRHYWQSLPDSTRILELLNKLEPIERAAVLYTGDLYHLAKHNASLVREFLGKLSTPATIPHPSPKDQLSKTPGDIIVLSTMLMEHETKGIDFADLATKNPNGYGLVAATAQNIISVLDEFHDLIAGFWVTKSMPASVYQFPSIIRKTAIVSDTDSTIFTNQYWSEWFVGKLDFTPTSLRIAYTTTFLTAQAVIHLLAMMSAHMGVTTEQIHQLSMKNEYFFPVFATTAMSKHYYANKSIQEGNVFAKMKREIKGKNLRDSTLPAYVRDGIENYTNDIINTFMEKGKLTLEQVLGPVAALENSIINNVHEGRFSDMPSLYIKQAETYTDPENNPYQHYEMWQEVFAWKYGNADVPPYRAIKFTVDLDSPSRLKSWLAKMGDREVAARMTDWLVKKEKKNLTTLYIPETILGMRGIPEEILSAIKIRKLVYGTTFPFYLVLETLGLHIVDTSFTKLVSDIWPPKPGETLVLSE